MPRETAAAKKSCSAQQFDYVPRKLALLVDLRGAGGDLLLGQLPNGVTKSRLIGIENGHRDRC